MQNETDIIISLRQKVRQYVYPRNLGYRHRLRYRPRKVKAALLTSQRTQDKHRRKKVQEREYWPRPLLQQGPVQEDERQYQAYQVSERPDCLRFQIPC